MARHTPGPWTWDEGEAQYDEGAIFGPDKVKVCDFGSAYGYEQRCGIGPSDADKALMLAAPELLEALQRCAELLDDYSDVIDGEDGVPVRPNRAMSLLQDVEDAIQKAEGPK